MIGQAKLQRNGHQYTNEITMSMHEIPVFIPGIESSFGGKHKLSNRWKDHIHCVIEKVNDLPVYSEQRVILVFFSGPLRGGGGGYPG